MQEQFTLTKVQELEFGILQFIKKVCDENQIRYYLAYGTLIGAVRHKGFIPWDDDIDIMMPRKDYKKLLAILNEQQHPYYKLISADTDKRFQVPLPKIVDTRTLLVQDYDIIEPVPLGVYVDIFLMDGAGDDYHIAVQHYDEAFKLYRYWKKSRLKLAPSSMSKLKGLLRWLKNLPFKMRGSRHYIQKLTEHNSQYDFDKSLYIATYETGTSDAKKCIFRYDKFGVGHFLEFNGELFQVPQDYDNILKSEYGNYMILPPKEKQVSHHSYNLQWNLKKMR
ncbi:MULTISPECIES: LicD family protein [Streptococcus anginosus group]|nr:MULTISPECIES: LicD family protein [Streptococcus anginosus group]MDK6972691.1 LicD family protein [Streptococcus constellatus]